MLLLNSCRDKRYSKRFFGSEESKVWNLGAFIIDDSLYRDDISFEIFKSDIYAENCTGVVNSLLLSDGKSNFYWQFHENGNKMDIHRSSDNDSLELLDDWLYSISGTYNVIKAKKKEMIFESNSTVGYAGQKVRLVLERVE